ncbi:uncharacterized protein [Watersipora subatra]|uniref:uncharacterized protein isoform X2 n=1 Tax=Watersipora subatra TaxID=2589382 RepID=UPI00355B1AC3
MHILVYKEWVNELQGLIDIIPAEKRLSQYLKRNQNGFTPLDEAIDRRSRTMSRCILDSLRNDGEKLNLLKAQSKRGWTALHRAVYKNDEELVRILLRTIPPALRKNLTSTVDSQGESFLQKSLSYFDSKVFKCILSLLSDNSPGVEKRERESRRELLLRKDRRGNTILHIITMKGNLDLFTYVMRQEKLGERLKLMKASDNDGRTLLHIAAENEDDRMVRCIFDLLRSNKRRFDLLYIADGRTQTALHYAARTDGLSNSNKGVSMLATMLYAVAVSQRVVLLGRKDREQNTALHEAIRVKNAHAISTIVESVEPSALTILLQPFNNKGMPPDLTRAVTHYTEQRERLTRPVQEENTFYIGHNNCETSDIESYSDEPSGQEVSSGRSNELMLREWKTNKTPSSNIASEKEIFQINGSYASAKSDIHEQECSDNLKEYSRDCEKSGAAAEAAKISKLKHVDTPQGQSFDGQKQRWFRRPQSLPRERQQMTELKETEHSYSPNKTLDSLPSLYRKRGNLTSANYKSADMSLPNEISRNEQASNETSGGAPNEEYAVISAEQACYGPSFGLIGRTDSRYDVL